MRADASIFLKNYLSRSNTRSAHFQALSSITRRSRRGQLTRLISRFIWAIIAVTATTTTANAIVPEDRWKRDILGEVNSPKSLLALEWCIARKIETPFVIRGENVVEINSYVTRLGVQIHDRNTERRIVYVANPRANDALRKIIDACA